MKEYNDDFRYIAERLDKELNVINDTVTRIARERDIPEEAFLPYEDIRQSVFEQFATDHMSEILDRLYKHLTPMFEAIQDLGYKVTRIDNTVILTNYSPAGEELNITLSLDGEDSVTLQLYMLYDNFDEEDHAYDLLDAKKNGLVGVPSIRELIDDAVAISDMYKQLYDAAVNARTLCKGDISDCKTNKNKEQDK